MFNAVKYESLDDCKNHYKNYIETNNNLNCLCKHLNENDDEVIIENSFFNLFTTNEYMFDCYKSNIKYYFEKILIDNGFILDKFIKEYDEILDFDIIKPTKTKINYNNLWLEFIEDVKESWFNEKYKIFVDRIKFFNLKPNNESLNKYAEYIYSDEKFNDHLNIIRFIRTDKYIDFKLEILKLSTFDVKIVTNTYNKIKLLRGLMKKNNFDYFNITLDKQDMTSILIDNNEWLLIKKLFRITKEKPKNKYELSLLFGSMIRHITNSDVIISKKYYFFNKEYYKLTINSLYVKKNIDLYYQYNNNDNIIKIE
jgi:hypothetical protein